MRVSVVIPVLNEAAGVAQAIQRAWTAGADEVIVVDGGSEDGTPALAEQANCMLATAEPGRAAQQNAGAQLAHGEFLLFLHADNWLAPDAAQQIVGAFETDSRVVGGSFQQRISAEGRCYRWLEHGNRWRARYLRLPYGDQGLFIRASIFHELGGFASVPLMEDVILAKQMRKRGRLAHLPGPLHVNARRWQNNGIWRQTLRNWTLITAFHLGVSPQRLAKFYPRHDQDKAAPRSLNQDTNHVVASIK